MDTFLTVALVVVSILVVGGFLVVTAGLWTSFFKDKFNRLIYLGLAFVATAVVIAGATGAITGLVVWNAITDPSPAATETVKPSDADESDYSGEYEVVFVEDLIAEASAETNGTFDPVCLGSESVDSFAYSGSLEDNVAESYMVPISENELYIVSQYPDGVGITYVDSDYSMAAVNDVAYANTFYSRPEDMGLDVDTSSEAYQVAEGCIS